MLIETEAERRERLRRLGERLIELSADDSFEIIGVKEVFYGATCDNCNDYGREIFENITLVYGR